MADVEKTAKALTLNMTRAITWWCSGEGVIHADVTDATKRGLVKRGLATWNDGLCPKLTDDGQQVRAFLLEKAKADEDAKTQALAEKCAAERKIRDEGYEAGVKFAEQRHGHEVENLLKQLQILVSRYPDCETVITREEMKERSDVGVLMAHPVDDGIRLAVRQR